MNNPYLGMTDPEIMQAKQKLERLGNYTELAKQQITEAFNHNVSSHSTGQQAGIRQAREAYSKPKTVEPPKRNPTALEKMQQREAALKATSDRVRLKQAEDSIAASSGKELLDKPQRPQEKAVANRQPGQSRPQTSQPVKLVEEIKPPVATPPVKRPTEPRRPTLAPENSKPLSNRELARDFGRAATKPKGTAAATPAVRPTRVTAPIKRIEVKERRPTPPIRRVGSPDAGVGVQRPGRSPGAHWNRSADANLSPAVGRVNSVEAEKSLRELLTPTGQSEQDWINLQHMVNDEVWNYPDDSSFRLDHDGKSRANYINDMLELNSMDEADYILRKSGPGEPITISYATRHTKNKESLYQRMMELSGHSVRDPKKDILIDFPGDDTAFTATDFEVNLNGNREAIKMVDAQDIMSPDGKLKLGVFKNGKNMGHIARDTWRRASNNDSFGAILGEIQHTAENESKRRPLTPHRSKFTMGNGSNLDSLSVNLDDRFNTPVGAEYLEQNMLIGGQHETRNIGGRILDKNGNPINALGPKKGPQGFYDATLPSRMYAVDLEELRDNVTSMSKSDFTKNPLYGYDSNLKIDFNLDPVKDQLDIQNLGRSRQAMDHLVSDPVKEALNRISKEQGGTDMFYGSLVPGDPKQIQDTLRKGWKGGLANTLLSGASREVGVNLGKGEYGWAGANFGAAYGTGAIGDQVLKRTLGSAFVRKAGQAVLSKLPSVATRFIATSTGGAGFTTPLAAAYGVYDLADGVVEGTTGKGIRQREQEAATAAVTRSYERKWNQPAPRGGFVPKDKPRVKPKVETAPVSQENINKANEALRGLAPEAEAQPAQITQGTPQVDKPDVGDHFRGWVNNVKSWFK